MAGIAGVFQSGETNLVEQMLESISHRGDFGKKIIEMENLTIGIVWSKHENERTVEQISNHIFKDGPGHGQAVEIARKDKHWEIHRDALGVAPLYTAFNKDGMLTFASEVKALIPFSGEILEMPAGHTLSASGLKKNFSLAHKELLHTGYKVVANELKSVIETAIKNRISSDSAGVWLSGGLNSSSIAALARPHVKSLHTFTAGLKDAPDLMYAKEVATYIGSNHHTIDISLRSMLDTLPDVVYQLESFDTQLIRSGIINLSVAYVTSDYVSEVFTGEGGAALFAAFEHPKSLPESLIDNSLNDMKRSLHNTVLQRVDRSASAFGTTAHVIFADPEVFGFALRIPLEMKLKDGVDKWILRKAMNELLPESVLTRFNFNFWQGAGVGNMLSQYASAKISDQDFRNERKLANGWVLNSKEELLYYRIFKEHFGELQKLNWMGRSKSLINAQS
jgi:asparagine synthase (glutamine-hydrolysing)